LFEPDGRVELETKLKALEEVDLLTRWVKQSVKSRLKE
jgi:hypothetical protein